MSSSSGSSGRILKHTSLESRAVRVPLTLVVVDNSSLSLLSNRVGASLSLETISKIGVPSHESSDMISSSMHRISSSR